MTDYVVMPESDYKDICDSVRRKTGKTSSLKSGEVSPEIDALNLGYDVSEVTAGAGDVLSGKKIVNASGTVVSGTMPNNGSVSKNLSTTDTSYTIPAGYHNGGGKVVITNEEKSVTPTKSSQAVTPTSGKVLSKVTVDAIPSSYITTGDATASAGEILAGETAYANGVKVTGTMTNRGAISASLNTGTTSYTVPAGYHNGGGKVNITLEEKTVNSSTSAQTVTPSSGKVLSKVTVNPIGTATQATPSISVNNSGLITASATQSAGYVAAGTKSATKQLTTQGAKTVTPTTSEQTAVASGVYTTGVVKVGAIPSNFVENGYRVEIGTVQNIIGNPIPTSLSTVNYMFIYATSDVGSGSSTRYLIAASSTEDMDLYQGKLNVSIQGQFSVATSKDDSSSNSTKQGSITVAHNGTSLDLTVSISVGTSGSFTYFQYVLIGK